MKLYLRILTVILVGYYYLGKTWAYLFIGELFLVFFAMTFVLLVIHITKSKIKGGIPIVLYILLFLGICYAFIGLTEHGINGIRDSVIITYAMFAIVFYNFILYSEINIVNWFKNYASYFKFLPLFYLFMIIANYQFSFLNPTIPFLNRSLSQVKAGDMGVHTLFALLLVITGFVYYKKREKYAVLVCIAAIAVYLAAFNRGGFLSILFPFIYFLYLKKKMSYLRYFFIGAFFFVLALILFSKIDAFQSNSRARTLSAEQLFKNYSAITNIDYSRLVDIDYSNMSDDAGVEGGNILWRLLWWAKIVNYTVFGDYLWTGKGFGVNLAEDDDVPHGATPDVRSPHNATMTILARTGIVGLALWIIFLWITFWRLIHHIRLSKAQHETYHNLFIILLCYWLSFLINSSLDVFLEGPMGGIPFWVIVGVIYCTFYQYQKEMSLRPIANESTSRS
ncbi:MAG: O-antigen ligase [Bacteroidetes bacterium]|nr:O-antigen ligase [Bacteroidota bacterium]MDA1119623.1 O-antigen ligase [Bacteroidota bacterium]